MCQNLGQLDNVSDNESLVPFIEHKPVVLDVCCTIVCEGKGCFMLDVSCSLSTDVFNCILTNLILKNIVFKALYYSHNGINLCLAN